MFDAHYANLVCSNSWINREFKEKPFKPGRKKLTNKELESQRQVHANTQRELKALVERGRMAITTLRERELLARTSRQIAAEEERAAANKAADEQKHAQQAREQKRLQMESLEAERALNHQITGLVGLCTQLVQEHAQPMGVVPPEDVG
ncbi:uncharacterized protein ACA1_364470 [Acanthamoeba castellanii str. Neff]|uniref:Uncharacterized protein n=1 Tax=Acanthamoeba castellanii (strain ATCC 30010 / Neff) TaxID=1257118 RepID=L8GLG8_ACACF|nr:uncharacterized protein ACA1_364470 [Acanthamoeba castellanii str. Neff]ELR13920.1 hypothetical protein ACA1_364470 [Acanthamoeba castellanii str. Neff]